MNEKVMFSNIKTGGEVTLLVGTDGVLTESQRSKFKRHVWRLGECLEDVSGIGYDTNKVYTVDVTYDGNEPTLKVVDKASKQC